MYGSGQSGTLSFKFWPLLMGCLLRTAGIFGEIYSRIFQFVLLLGASSTDLGLEDKKVYGSGTLSSSTDTDGFSGSPSLVRKGNYIFVLYVHEVLSHII